MYLRSKRFLGKYTFTFEVGTHGNARDERRYIIPQMGLFTERAGINRTVDIVLAFGFWKWGMELAIEVL